MLDIGDDQFRYPLATQASYGDHRPSAPHLLGFMQKFGIGDGERDVREKTRDRDLEQDVFYISKSRSDESYIGLIANAKARTPDWICRELLSEDKATRARAEEA